MTLLLLLRDQTLQICDVSAYMNYLWKLVHDYEDTNMAYMCKLLILFFFKIFWNLNSLNRPSVQLFCSEPRQSWSTCYTIWTPRAVDHCPTIWFTSIHDQQHALLSLSNPTTACSLDTQTLAYHYDTVRGRFRYPILKGNKSMAHTQP